MRRVFRDLLSPSTYLFFRLRFDRQKSSTLPPIAPPRSLHYQPVSLDSPYNTRPSHIPFRAREAPSESSDCLVPPQSTITPSTRPALAQRVAATFRAVVPRTIAVQRHCLFSTPTCACLPAVHGFIDCPAAVYLNHHQVHLGPPPRLLDTPASLSHRLVASKPSSQLSPPPLAH